MRNKQKDSQSLELDKIEINEKELLKFIEFVNFQRDFLKGMRQMLFIQLKHCFGVLPKKIVKRLNNADAETLENWGLALLTAQTLNDVFIKTND